MLWRSGRWGQQSPRQVGDAVDEDSFRKSTRFWRSHAHRLDERASTEQLQCHLGPRRPETFFHMKEHPPRRCDFVSFEQPELSAVGLYHALPDRCFKGRSCEAVRKAIRLDEDRTGIGE